MSLTPWESLAGDGLELRGIQESISEAEFQDETLLRILCR